MLVVLIGDGLGVLVCAVRMLELFSRVNIRILILESLTSGIATTLTVGPLPHCITAIPPTSQNFFQVPSLHNGHSSIMYLMSIHRAPKNKRRNVSAPDRPNTHESLIVSPCPFPSNSVSYHPQVYSNYLKTSLAEHKNVSFALMRNSGDVDTTIRNLGEKAIVFNYHNEVLPNLAGLHLSSVNWEGVPAWKMPDIVHWVKKKKTVFKVVPRGDLTFDVLSNSTILDLNGALVTAELLTEYLNSLLVTAKLRWPRL